MKKVLVGLLVFFTLTITQAFAYNLKSFTSDAKIMSAMQLLEQNGEYVSFNQKRKNRSKQG